MRFTIRLYFYCEFHDDGGYVDTVINTNLPVDQIIKIVESSGILYNISFTKENFCSSKQCDESYVVPFGFKIFDADKCAYERFIKSLDKYCGGFEYRMFDENNITKYVYNTCILNAFKEKHQV